MERYIAHALSLESGDTDFSTESPKSTKETPSPSRTASPTARKRKKGIWPAVGSTPTSAGGKRTGPEMKAGIATSVVTIATFIQVFINCLLCGRRLASKLLDCCCLQTHRPFPVLNMNQFVTPSTSSSPMTSKP